MKEAQENTASIFTREIVETQVLNERQQLLEKFIRGKAYWDWLSFVEKRMLILTIMMMLLLSRLFSSGGSLYSLCRSSTTTSCKKWKKLTGNRKWVGDYYPSSFLWVILAALYSFAFLVFPLSWFFCCFFLQRQTNRMTTLLTHSSQYNKEVLSRCWWT